MCNLRTNYRCGHVRYRKITCKAKSRRQKYCFPFFATMPQCINTNPQVSFDPCPSCLRQQDIELQPIQPLPGRIRPTSEELMIEAAMLPGHFDVCPGGRNRNSAIHSDVQTAVTMVPGVDYAPHIEQRYPPYLNSAPARSETTRMQSRSGPSRPRGAPLPSSPRERSMRTPAQHRRTNTSRWVDTTRYPRGDHMVSPVLPGWSDPDMVSPTSSIADQFVVEGGLGFF